MGEFIIYAMIATSVRVFKLTEKMNRERRKEERIKIGRSISLSELQDNERKKIGVFYAQVRSTTTVGVETE